jgi:hypothetical protein
MQYRIKVSKKYASLIVIIHSSYINFIYLQAEEELLAIWVGVAMTIFMDFPIYLRFFEISNYKSGVVLQPIKFAIKI